eukprot:Pompholyxophrys_punicea_v1_NODE_784_length_1305_cov_18.841727.p1 type:complete len:208 gc:universal NODE_784_length_1305_cov_18.841727:167-790(+)
MELWKRRFCENAEDMFAIFRVFERLFSNFKQKAASSSSSFSSSSSSYTTHAFSSSSSSCSFSPLSPTSFNSSIPPVNALNLLMHPSASSTARSHGKFIPDCPAGPKISLFNMNVRSLGAHWTDFEHLITSLDFEWDFIAVSELWCNGLVIADSLLQGYRFTSKTRKRQGGGVGLFVRDNLDYVDVPCQFSTCDGLCISCEHCVGKLY